MYTFNYFEVVSVSELPLKAGAHYPPYWEVLYELHPGQHALVLMLTDLSWWTSEGSKPSLSPSLNGCFLVQQGEERREVADRPPHRCSPPALLPAGAPGKGSARDQRLSYVNEVQQETFLSPNTVFLLWFFPPSHAGAELIKSYAGGHMGCKNLPHYRKAHNISVTILNSFASCYWVNHITVLQ